MRNRFEFHEIARSIMFSPVSFILVDEKNTIKFDESNITPREKNRKNFFDRPFFRTRNTAGHLSAGETLGRGDGVEGRAQDSNYWNNGDRRSRIASLPVIRLLFYLLASLLWGH